MDDGESGSAPMIPSLRFGSIGLGVFLSICGAFFLPSATPAQGSGINLTGSANCNAPDFDAHVQLLNGPGDYFTIVVNKRNISHHPCRFDGSMSGLSVVPDRVQGHSPIGMCYDCEHRLPNGQYPVVPLLTIDPGQVVRQTFRWKTAPPNDTEPCRDPDWIAGPVLLVTPSLFKKICSDIEVSRFSPVADSDAAQKEGSAAKDGGTARFALSSDKSMYYQGEFFSVHVSLARLSTETPSEEQTCPTLYLRTRSPDGATRIDEVHPLAFKTCKEFVPGHPPGDWQSGFELDSGANSRWAGLGEHAIEVLQLMGSPDDPNIQFASSSVLRVQIADPSAIPRKWGPHAKGVAADITLDKGTFRVGEDVHLHLAVQNFDAEVPLYSGDPVWDPCSVVVIEVQDAAGHRVPDNERSPNWSLCMGHGRGPIPYVKGKVVPLERTLGGEGWLPNHPGTYSIVLTWAPTTGSEPPAEAIGIFRYDLKPYAAVHATATIHIVSADTAEAN
jgi:hypothetical protein